MKTFKNLSTSVIVIFLIILLFMFNRPFAKGNSIPYPLKVNPVLYSFQKDICLDKDPISVLKGNNTFSCEPFYRFCIYPEIPLKPDTRGNLHPITAYLKNFNPFDVENPLLSWKWTLDNIKYTDDYKKFHKNDIWQFAKNTYISRQGDCEDSSILLCDWLRSQGYDAKVALGLYKKSGWHAWVIFPHKNNTYLLECTGRSSLYSKEYDKFNNTLARRYKPLGLFDEHFFWVAKDKNRR
ncbi:MAG: transglutaminase domain-containing protein [Candidatus Aureabacteria bacterium]|nr:transglutaminase domain-containing protein [Candidatus Auribacterota bacterium]